MITLVFSAICSASETALFSLSTFERKKLIGQGSNFLKKCFENLSKVLVLILLANIIVNVGFSLLMEHQIAVYLRGHPSSTLLSVFLSTFILVFFGEILPKNLAYERRKVLAKVLAPLWYFLSKIFAPGIKILSKTGDKLTNACLYFLTLDGGKVRKKQEMTRLLAMARKKGSLSRFEQSMLQNIGNLHETDSRDLMTPRVESKVIRGPINRSDKNFRKQVIDIKRHWIPVYEESIDNIVGVLDSWRYLLQGGDPNDYLTKPVYVPETMNFFKLFSFFKEKKIRVAIVVDEYGGFLGLVNYNDIIEEVTGDLKIVQQISHQYQYLGRGRYQVSGDCPLWWIEDRLKVKIEENLMADTINGLVQEISGNLPQEGGVFLYEGLEIKIIEVSNQKLIRAKIAKKKIKG